MYELVMTEGTVDDVRTYIDLDVLLEMWDTMWLATHVAAVRPSAHARLPACGGSEHGSHLWQ